MKRNIKLILISVLLVVAMVFLSSCTISDLSALLNQDKDTPPSEDSSTPPSEEGDGNPTSGNDGVTEDYMTREEVEALIAGIKQNVSVTEQNINVTSNHEKNLLAASKGLLSAVSITATFNITYTYGGIFSQPTTETKQATSGGAGVIYKLDKAAGNAYIITNYHVVYNVDSDAANKISQDIKVYLYGQEYADYAMSASYVGGSMRYDIAVLKISGNDVLKNGNAMEATFANSDEVSVLETAIAIGNPAGGGISATVGSINVDSESITMTAVDEVSDVTMRVMRIDAAINSGNSGGGLFNDEGNVIGIVNAKITSSSIDNIGYAIPSNIAKNVADNIIYYDNIDAANDSVYRIMLGIQVTILNSGSEYDTETGKVHKVETVIIGDTPAQTSPAYGKLAKGDVINSITIDGVTYKITRQHMVIDAMLAARQTSAVSMNITSGGETKDVAIDVSQVTPVIAETVN